MWLLSSILFSFISLSLTNPNPDNSGIGDIQQKLDRHDKELEVILQVSFPFETSKS